MERDVTDHDKEALLFTRVSHILVPSLKFVSSNPVVRSRNYPFNETYATLIPAILMGNSVVMKAPGMGMILQGLVIHREI